MRKTRFLGLLTTASLAFGTTNANALNLEVALLLSSSVFANPITVVGVGSVSGLPNTFELSLTPVDIGSRRDIAEVFANPAFADAAAHKWAALARNDRMLVQALHLPELQVPSALLALASGGGRSSLGGRVEISRVLLTSRLRSLDRAAPV